MKKILIFSFLVLNLTACQLNTKKNHPLIDKIWSVSKQEFISANELNQIVLNNQIILLGETHDNARHHQLQAKIISNVAKKGESPAVAYEMLNTKQQSSINEYLSTIYSSGIKAGADEVSKQVEDLSKLINWEESGWPDWELYHPVFYHAVDNQLPIIAANLDTKIIRKVIKQGSNVLDETYQALLIKYQYDAVLKKELEKEILASHCDMLPEKMLSPMLMGQQVRDLAMTRAIQTARARNKKSDKLILIAGAGHTRTDYGIPFYLHQETPGIKTLSLSFMEVSKDELLPENYIEAWGESTKELPFDYVWFTERAEREDQCEKMRAYMDKKKNKK